MLASTDGVVGRGVVVGFSRSSDTRAAVNELLDELRAESAALTLVFYSPEHDAQVVAEVMGDRLGERGIGGSTAGELSGDGFTHGTVTGMSFHAEGLRAAASLIQDLSTASLLPMSSVPRDLSQQIGVGDKELDPERHLWLLLLDGISGREDLVAPVLGRQLRGAGLVGGSLGDETRFSETTIVFGGRVYTDAGVMVLLEYERPFELIRHSHLEFTAHSFEVTKVSKDGRVLEELDGRPAREVFGEALGLTSDEVTSEVCSLNPLGHRFRGKAFACSVLRPVGSGLSMAYSLQRGQALSILRPVDQVQYTGEAVESALSKLRARGGDPQAMLMFHCLGRYIEAQSLDLLPSLFGAMNQLPVCGLNTYGEQFGSMHLNHSITGVIFG